MVSTKCLSILFFFGTAISTRISFTPDNLSNEYGELESLDDNLNVEDNNFVVSSTSIGLKITLYDDMVDLDDEYKVTFDTSSNSDNIVINLVENNKYIYIECNTDTCYISSINIDFIPSGGINKPTGEYIEEYIAAHESVHSHFEDDRRRLPDSGSIVPTKWSCPIPYEFHYTLTVNPADIIEAMDYISKNTGWTFIQHTNEPDYLSFVNGGGCWSYIGRQETGLQYISIVPGCSFGSIIHEIGHAIGIHHEHVREDRDTYVYINVNNIDSNYYSSNFVTSNEINYCDYDYGSVMHYGQYGFAVDTTQRTVIPINDLGDICYVGQRFELSFEDVIHYNKAIDGNKCSTLSPDECESTDIVLCGATSTINGFEVLFQEYIYIDQYNGKSRYRSKRRIFDLYLYMYWSINNYWLIELGFGGSDYAYLFEEDLFDINGNWVQYSYSYFNYLYDPAMIVSPVDCTSEDECLTSNDIFGCTSCNYEFELTYDESCETLRCKAETCGPAPAVCDIDDELDSYNCPIPCDNYPCKCNNDCQFCKVCHENGCNQCDDDYFKKSFNYPCINCQEYFGDECMFCQDFDGCGQCQQGYHRVYNTDCQLWECQ